MENVPYLSVIIPVYTEGEILGRTLLEIDHHLRPKDFRYEILVIVDGSPNNTGELAKNYIKCLKNLHVIENDINRGKGYAVRLGLLQAKGAFRLYTDADGSAPIKDADEFLQACQNGFIRILTDLLKTKYRLIKGEYNLPKRQRPTRQS